MKFIPLEPDIITGTFDNIFLVFSIILCRSCKFNIPYIRMSFKNTR